MSQNDNVSETVGVPPDDVADDLLERATPEPDEDAVLDTGYSPPEKPWGIDRFGTTLEEERQGEPLSERLRQEEPERQPHAGDPGGARGVKDPNDPDDLAGEAEADMDKEGEGELLDDQVGHARSGRLVDPDEGAHTDTEKDVIATDVGIDGGAASAEEAAMHIVDADELDREL